MDSDTARRHFKACSPGSVDPLVAEARRGKARQACDICAHRKLSCDTASPCSRCVSSKVTCTYERRHVDASTGESSLPAAAVVRSVGTASDSSRTKIPIQFLLAFTTPAEHEATTTLVTASRNEFTGLAMSTPMESQSTFELNFEYYGAPFWDQDNWVTEFVAPSKQDFQHNAGQNGLLSTHRRVETATENRLAQMCLELASTHEFLLVHNPNSPIPFDKRLAEQVFTEKNLENSVQAYFSQLHQYYPILHPPSFDREAVSLSLLLAVFLFGSLASAPTDSTLSARKFCDIAEEYIFNHHTIQQLYNGQADWVWSEERIEVLQAALIIEIVQNGTNNEETRRRLRLRRHPWYVALLRSCGLFHDAGEAHASYTGQSKRQSFIAKETRTR